MEESNFAKIEQQPAAANMMERLPQEVIIRILSRLPITYLMQSKLVCRAWLNLIQDPLLASEHFSNMADNDPSFILQSHSRTNNQLFFIDFSNDSQGKLISKKPPTSVMVMSLVDSCNGFLCMRNATARAIYICNPFTRLSTELPKVVTSPAQLGHLEFGFHPTTKEYKLIHAKLLGKRDAPINVNQSTLVQYSEVHVLTLGSPAWRNLGTVPHRFVWQTSKAIVNGRLHWLSRPKKCSWATLLISFDLETEQFQEVPKPDFCGLDKRFHYLVVLRGCVSVATYQNRGLEVWVMKEYGVKESWIKEFNIGTYLPRTLHQPKFHGRSFPRLAFPNSCVRVICSLKSGEILLVYAGSRSLVLYDPQRGTFKELTFQEMPVWFKITAHVGSLNWLDTLINI